MFKSTPKPLVSLLAFPRTVSEGCPWAPRGHREGSSPAHRAPVSATAFLGGLSAGVRVGAHPWPRGLGRKPEVLLRCKRGFSPRVPQASAPPGEGGTTGDRLRFSEGLAWVSPSALQSEGLLPSLGAGAEVQGPQEESLFR